MLHGGWIEPDSFEGLAKEFSLFGFTHTHIYIRMETRKETERKKEKEVAEGRREGREGGMGEIERKEEKKDG